MQSFREFSSLLKILIILSLILGIFFRFYNLDGKVYSSDETFSSLRIFGRNIAEVIDNRIVTVEELQNYQRIDTNKSLTDSVKRLIAEPYVFPPLYSILMQPWAHFWTPYFDNPAVIPRSFSALISVFALICIYWLCWELSGCQTLAWVATALIAISPFHVQYAQIVRTYSLTTVATLLSSASLIRAMRVQTKLGWIIYALTVAIGLYSNLLFGFVAMAHGAYVFFIERFRLSKTLKLYLLASIAGISAFLPWFILFISKPGLVGYSVKQVLEDASLSSLIKKWVINIRPIFIDLNDPWVEFTKAFKPIQTLLLPCTLLMVVFSIYFICRKAPRSVSLFILSMIALGGLILMIKDGITGGSFSTRLRYMIPYVLGIEIAVAYFIASQIQSTYTLNKKLGEIILSTLIVGGIVSCGIISQAESWWAFGSPDSPIAARKISQATRPVVIFDNWGDALTMSYMLAPKVHCHLTRRADFHLIENKGRIYEGFSDIFLYNPSDNRRRKLEESGSKMELAFKSYTNLPQIPKVWRLVKQ